MSHYLVTGAAGFIGFHVCQQLLKKDIQVVGIDNLNDYYSVELKESRLAEIIDDNRFTFKKLDIADTQGVNALFNEYCFTKVINLAAQAGVRYSLEQPHAYIQSNIVGFMNLLEACRQSDSIEHLVYASSSSVYGANGAVPFSVHHNVDHPVSLYAATKKSNELMAHTYSHLYDIPTTGLRFFTVYGPWGRPDMALFKFTKAIVNGEPMDVYNHGNMMRDFTYVDDIVEGVLRVTENTPQGNPDWDNKLPDPSSSIAPYKIYNIGNNQPVKLEAFISALEDKLGKKAIKNYLPMQPGDVYQTYADIDALVQDVDFRPGTSIEEGIEKFINWYLSYYR